MEQVKKLRHDDQAIYAPPGARALSSKSREDRDLEEMYGGAGKRKKSKAERKKEKKLKKNESTKHLQIDFKQNSTHTTCVERGDTDQTISKTDHCEPSKRESTSNTSVYGSNERKNDNKHTNQPLNSDSQQGTSTSSSTSREESNQRKNDNKHTDQPWSRESQKGTTSTRSEESNWRKNENKHIDKSWNSESYRKATSTSRERSNWRERDYTRLGDKRLDSGRQSTQRTFKDIKFGSDTRDAEFFDIGKHLKELNRSFYFPKGFIIEGDKFFSIKHCMLYKKAEVCKDSKLMERAREAKSYEDISKLESDDAPIEWERGKREAMKAIIQERLKHEVILQNKLLETVELGKPMEYSEDPYWGNGGSSQNGKNIYGRILSDIRYDLVQSPTPTLISKELCDFCGHPRNKSTGKYTIVRPGDGSALDPYYKSTFKLEKCPDDSEVDTFSSIQQFFVFCKAWYAYCEWYKDILATSNADRLDEFENRIRFKTDNYSAKENSDFWKSKIKNHLKKAYTALFWQNEDFKKALFATRDSIVVYASADEITGVGADESLNINHRCNWMGMNILGYVLSEILEEKLQDHDTGTIRLEAQSGRLDTAPCWGVPSSAGGKYLTFFFGYQSPFSQHHYAEFKLDGKDFLCTEQYYMYMKAEIFHDQQMKKKILACFNPKEMKNLGKKVQNFNQYQWYKQAEDIVFKANYAKFTQNVLLKKALLSTDDNILVEASPFDRNWGIGMNASNPQARHPNKWRGKNWLGEALMKVRSAIRRNQKSLKIPKGFGNRDIDLPQYDGSSDDVPYPGISAEDNDVIAYPTNANGTAKVSCEDDSLSQVTNMENGRQEISEDGCPIEDKTRQIPDDWSESETISDAVSTVQELSIDRQSALKEPDENIEATLKEPGANIEATLKEQGENIEGILKEPFESRQDTLTEPCGNTRDILTEPTLNTDSSLQDINVDIKSRQQEVNVDANRKIPDDWFEAK